MDDSLDIAIVGMDCRFPGARDADAFWENLAAGRESVTPFNDDEFVAAGGDPARLDDPYLVKVAAAVDGIDRFDAGFFGYPPAEAALLDPQHRLFLQCCHRALEHAGHGGRTSRAAGVYAGASQSRYFLFNVFPHLAEESDPIAMQHAMLGSANSTLATRVSYELDLTGPSIGVQTACSTSLVAVHLACQDLLSYRCDLALAGGSTLNPAPRRGYRYVQDGPFSPDGHCRAFDADAAGMVPGDGVGVVVLKRIADAIADGDHIHAVIKGSAVNNDGRRKLGFAAPSVPGQAEVIVAAHTMAGIDADSLGYVEAHGTGTPVGDPIELAALTEAFRRTTGRKGFCAIGSVKTNIGHTDSAAGVAGLIKAVLSVEHGHLAPSLHFRSANPLLELDGGPFYVNTSLRAWPDGVRRAAVNSVGIGGTNAHVVIEQAPPRVASEPGRPWSLLVLSAKTKNALAEMSTNLGEYLSGRPGLNIADVAHTLQVGRAEFPVRRTAVCRTAEEASAQLLTGGAVHEFTEAPGPIVFMFPGAGAQYPGMADGLYDTEPVFRAEIDRCAEILAAHGVDLRQAMAAGTNVFPVMLSVEYALAKLLMSAGVRPKAFIGHSLGEYTAACLAGVMSVDDVLPLVVHRERLFYESAGAGGLLSVALGEHDVRDYLTGNLCLAAVNSPTVSVVSGPETELDGLRKLLTSKGIDHQQVRFGAAAHSSMLDPMLREYGELLAAVRLAEPTIPYVSNVTGTWIQPGQATDPRYWIRHTRDTVHFGAGLAELARQDKSILLEVGPGRMLTKLAADSGVAVACMRHPKATVDDVGVLLDVLGVLWRHGVDIDWAATRGEATRLRVPLPGYPFRDQRCWIDPPAAPRVVAGGVRWTSAHQARMAEAEQRLLHRVTVERTPDELVALLNELSLRYIWEYLRGNGISTVPGTVHTIDQLVERLGVVPEYRKLLAAFVQVLVEESLVAVDGGEIRFVAELDPGTTAAALADRIAMAYPDYAEDIALLRHCVEHYDQVLTGELAATQVLLPDGDDGAQRSIIEKRLKSSDIVVYRELIAQTVARMVAEAGRPVRILEVGAGRGYVSWAVCDALRNMSDVEYHFTDLGRSFVLDGQRRAREEGFDFVRFGVLDIGEDPAPQGYRGHGFDIVLAFNVLHATKDLRRSLGNVRDLLAPGGMLFLLEASRQRRWSMLTTGLYEGWWYFDDDIRDHTPLVPPDRWRQVLAEEGFGEIGSYPDREGAVSDHAVIVGQAPGAHISAPAPTVLAEQASFNQRPALATDYVAPNTQDETDMAGMWCAALGLDRVGVRDNFFDLGGESLLAMQLISRVRKAFGVDLALREMFDNPTVAEFTALVVGRRAADTPRSTPGLIQPGLIQRSARRTRRPAPNGEQ
nr:type I polyketide synthase [Kibdelosporangium sp. MJ126-NF4]CEL17996.1 Malonyl CoA-acyl carrier protein transacylase [Kibdelosporangium sp. MJ126-NF4]CTQ90776.1 Malonyl CoA-acyl carrier protein transacylase (EC 2.3.1.39) [Kibdelosporangium sp. MJ126-NF4]